MKKLRISLSLALPRDAATSTIVVYGGKGMGKTNFGSVLVEEFARSGIRFAVIDPMGVWWGLRHGADGKSPGIDVLILGGRHGDLPIGPESGELVADLVVDENANVVIDISRHADGSMWSIADRVRFVTAYIKRLYQRQGEKRRPLNQVIDECARFAPQVIRSGELDVAKCMGAIAVLVEEGRNVGVGVVLLTQRSARLNKDVAELADCMIAFRTLGPNSRRAVLDWLGEHVEKSRIKEIDQKLREIPRGTALVVSPGWLEYEGIVAIRKRETFDSSDTPKSGKQRRASGGRKPDLAKYRERLAALVELQKETDPKELKKTIADLRKQLAAKPGPAPKAPKPAKVTTIAPIKAADLKRIETSTKRLEARADGLEHAAGVLDAAVSRFATELTALRMTAANIRATAKGSVEARESTPEPHVGAASRLARGHVKRTEIAAINRGTVPAMLPAAARDPSPRTSATDEDIGGAGGRKILAIAIARKDGVSHSELAVLTGYRKTSRVTYLQKLRRAGLVETIDGKICATAAGRKAMPDVEELPTGAKLREHWLAKLPAGEKRVLEVLIAAHPKTVSSEKMEELTGYAKTSRVTYYQKLRAKQLIDTDRSGATASAMLFDGAA